MIILIQNGQTDNKQKNCSITIFLAVCIYYECNIKNGNSMNALIKNVIFYSSSSEETINNIVLLLFIVILASFSLVKTSFSIDFVFLMLGKDFNV